MPVVVVESPAKAKTINKYLGSGYTVLASYGHVRDLPPKDGSVIPDNDFEMLWEVGNDSRKHVKAIADALKEDNNLILATDPDREGEAISWHLEEALRKRKAIKKDTPVSRVVFNAIEIVRAEIDGIWVTGLPETARIITVGQGFVNAGEIVAPAPANTSTAVDETR